MFELVHEVPGRLRLIGPVRESRAVARRLSSLPGVRRVLIRPASRSLIVFHDGAAGRRQAILASLDLVEENQVSIRTASDLLDRLIESAAERLLGHIAQALVAAVL